MLGFAELEGSLFVTITIIDGSEKTQLGIQLFNFRVRVLLKSAVIRLLIIKLLLLNYHVRPPIKIPKLNTTFPIKVLLSKPVVTDYFRICK